MIHTPPQAVVISKDGVYRYFLSRNWFGGEKTVAFIGLNPSTADAHVDDPTIRRCIGFAKLWGGKELWMVNLFAFRSTDPLALKAASDPVGAENDHWLDAAVNRADIVVAAWGNHGVLNCRAEMVLLRYQKRLSALKITKSGMPSHPLYVPAQTQLISYP